MDFLLGKMSFGQLLSYLKGGFMLCSFPKMYKAKLRPSLRKKMIAPGSSILYAIKRPVALGRRKRPATFQASDVTLQVRYKQAYNQARRNQHNEFFSLNGKLHWSKRASMAAR